MPHAAWCSAVLARVLSPGEVQAMEAARFISFPHRTVITLIAHGRTAPETAEALQLKPSTIRSYLATAARMLESSRRMPALVHAAYSHPSFPAPPRSEECAPKLSPGERIVLLHHVRGRPCPGSGTLLSKLNARTPAHAIHLAWQLGLLSERSPSVRPPPDSPPCLPPCPG
ncbi:hypothetical protein [Streptomyces roseifaciens]|uniref:hypothetical protein n=1 Tax=Streptomyces roseifaciens TaxID=1488406 RepID=UPI0011873B1F|nr:hypothetical protein [Streptomyces roseifaciens]